MKKIIALLVSVLLLVSLLTACGKQPESTSGAPVEKANVSVVAIAGPTGVGLVNLINLYDPEVIALGGGVSHAGQFLLDAVNAKLPKLVFYKTMPYARVELARLGNDAGIIGAAMLAR